MEHKTVKRTREKQRNKLDPEKKLKDQTFVPREKLVEKKNEKRKKKKQRKIKSREEEEVEKVERI